ncbi:hypothetical protein [Bacillus sp. RAR_GA_16]|uniref:hypothetical protein n=1 Tax=Bacillus sp. RAR_GA_16 TaxID=2876774 RepID=UPI001CCB95F3|nr:hypothetical protein [Bacillus sp. RAR_GA_16]MCA0174031.1 hypothetical protein [Bacillus sp. RAR_GA_16]
MEAIHLVVLNDSNAIKYIPMLRKKTAKSINEIKHNIRIGNAVMACEDSDAEELKTLVTSADELLLMGASIKIYEDKQEITLNMVKNLINTIEGIAIDREEMDNLMCDDHE